MTNRKRAEEAKKPVGKRFCFKLYIDNTSWIIDAPIGCKVMRASSILEPDYLTTTDGACLAEKIVLFAAQQHHHGLKLVTEHVPCLNR